MKNKRWIWALAALVIAFGAGAWLTWRYVQQQAEERIERDATVLLERVREVMQLVTVEGTFNELYNEKNYREVTLYLPIPTNWSFAKTALLQVKGRVLVGYDMTKTSITIDSTQRLIRLSNLPEPRILAVDHEVIYRDLEESFFNSFSPEDYTQLNKNAKEILVRKAGESGLLDQARARGNQLIETTRYLAEAAGWRLTYEGEPATPLAQ